MRANQKHIHCILIQSTVFSNRRVMHKIEWEFKLKQDVFTWIHMNYRKTYGRNSLKHHIFLKIVYWWKNAELLDLTRCGSSWSSSLNPHYVMLWNKTNIDSTEPGCTTSQKMMCILISNSLQYMGPAREEKKVAYKIRHLNPHHKVDYRKRNISENMYFFIPDSVIAFPELYFRIG